MLVTRSQLKVVNGSEIVTSLLCLGSENVGAPWNGLQIRMKVQCPGTFLGHNRSKS